MATLFVPSVPLVDQFSGTRSVCGARLRRNHGADGAARARSVRSHRARGRAASTELNMIGNFKIPFISKDGPPPPPLYFDVGYAFLAHPEKQTGEDAFYIEGNSVGVFDGVGGAAVNGVDPRLYSQNLALLTLNNVQENGVKLSVKSLIDAAEANTLVGASTACVVGMEESGRMNGINLGDSGVRIVRDGKLMWRTKEQQHFFNCPYQLGSDSSDSVQMGQNVNQRVRKGDWVIVATDGLFDNVFDDDIVSIVSEFGDDGSPTELAEKLAAFAVQNAKNPTTDVPFAVASRKAGQDHQGGKLDDVTVLCCRVTDDSVEPLSLVSVLEEDAAAMETADASG
ncbi:putative protein phosphatase 2C 26 [Porphyridium purpureum]|uniref:Protein phosphatase n=1 Tax=Porphyridium purpureum TaxID=35688 RepID=A0A5J4YV82_PORPP|nr:putative protein phosphatase 2C 26 [Porphyridium purpureum]|eukprot:POR7771..scf209_3